MNGGCLIPEEFKQSVAELTQSFSDEEQNSTEFKTSVKKRIQLLEATVEPLFAEFRNAVKVCITHI